MYTIIYYIYAYIHCMYTIHNYYDDSDINIINTINVNTT